MSCTCGNVTKVDTNRFRKNGITYYLKGFTRKEAEVYLSGRSPKYVKADVNENFQGKKALLTVIGYKVHDVVVRRNGVVATVIFKRNDG